MRIVICNWKDLRNPDAGGAEVFTHEVARRWVQAGHEVTLFCRSFPGADPEDALDGVKVVRRGGKLTVYRHARRWLRAFANHYDLIIDEVNTRPFMAHRVATNAQVVMLIYQLAAEVWKHEMPFPLSLIGRYILEPRWLRQNRNVPTITISRSTADDLQRLGFRHVNIVPVGISAASPPRLRKEADPTLVYVGRLIETKRPLDALEAHRLVRKRFPNAQLWVIGDGYLRRKLERTASPGVTQFGRVSEQRKAELMARAHLLLFPGVREGWGLTITEANAVGTPAVGYRISGVVDAIRDRQTGMIVDPTPEAMAAAANRLFEEPTELSRLKSGAIDWARSFDWDTTARAFLEFAQGAISRASRTSR